MIKIRAYDIVWDTDGKKIDLPVVVELEVEEEDLDEDYTCVADKLSDIYGWCVSELKWDELNERN